MIGKTISQYKIIEKLAQGGMGVVYKAEDMKLRRIVALKFLPKELGVHEPERARFLQEAQAASALNHPNVCTIYDIKEEGEYHFIVMEYVDGETLREKISRCTAKGLFAVQDVIQYAIQIGEALQEAHSHGIVHRDIKPENIMVNTKNQIKVMDFGLAKLKGSLKLTKTSSTVGTLSYMAPEHIQGSEVDARGDIFSFGIVLYEMLAGHLPFRGDHEAAMMYSILNESPAPIQKHRPELSSEFLHILNRALEKDPEERYQSVQDMLIDLRRLKKETTRVVRTDIAERAAPDGLTRPDDQTEVRGLNIRKKMVIISASAILLALVVILYFMFFTGRVPVLNRNMSFRTLEVPFTQMWYPSISRDGQWISFPARDNNNEWSIYFMNVAKGNPLRLIREPLGECWDTDISPDASEILYDYSPPGRERGIYVVSSAGGVGRRIAEPGGLAKWHPDGNRIGYIRLGRFTIPSESGKREFWTVNRDGSENHLEFVDTLSYVFAGMSFDWSPDGNSIAWLRSFPDFKEIIIRDMKSGKERQLTSYGKEMDEVVWASNNQIFFTSRKSGNINVWMIPASGGEATQVTKGAGPDLGVRISGDAKRLLFMEQRVIQHLWTANIDGSDAKQLTFDDKYIEGPSFSPDNKRISFTMQYSDILHPSSHIFIMQNDGTDRIQLTTGNDQYYYSEWSPDGKYMTYASKRVDEPIDSSRIYLIEINNPGTPKLIGRGVGVRWIDTEKLVLVVPQPYRSTLYSIHSDKSIEASPDTTVYFPLPDGKYIAIRDYRKDREGWWLKNVGDVQGGTLKRILSRDEFSASWPSANLHYIIYLQPGGEVWRISVPEGKRERLPDILKGIAPQTNIQISFDDQHLVFLKEKLDTRLVLIDNLFE
jgi:Tol biopolymer transport system component/predicted Ser/Thr protein kinase